MFRPRSPKPSSSNTRRTCRRTTACGCAARTSSCGARMRASAAKAPRMLREFEEIERTAGAEKAADVRRALHFLLRRQFVFAGDPRTTTVCGTLMDTRFRNTIDGFFDSCGYRVHRDEEAQWAGITAIGEDVPLPRMKLDETIVVLVLAAHWQDEVNVGAVEGRATVVTTLNTLYDRYREMARPNSST